MTNGFSLVELVAVVALIAILASIAFPSWRNAIYRAQRSEGKVLLQTIMAAEERYYANFNRYTDVAGVGGLGLAPVSQPGGFYAIDKIELGDDGQSLVAIVSPQQAQQGDSCGSLRMDSRGRRGASGHAVTECW